MMALDISTLFLTPLMVLVVVGIRSCYCITLGLLLVLFKCILTHLNGLGALQMAGTENNSAFVFQLDLELANEGFLFLHSFIYSSKALVNK